MSNLECSHCAERFHTDAAVREWDRQQAARIAALEKAVEVLGADLAKSYGAIIDRDTYEDVMNNPIAHAAVEKARAAR